MSDHPDRLTRTFAALHRVAIRSYPEHFRALFGEELQRVFELRVAGRAGSTTVRTLLATFLLLDAALSGPLERLRGRHERWAWPRHHGPSSQRTLTMTLETIRRDVALALRQFGRAPMFATLTVASLALGIGANTAMFAIVHSVLLRPLPYHEPDRLITIWSDNTKNAESNSPVSPANFEAFRAAPSLARVEGLYSFLTPVQVRIDAEPEQTLASQVTPGMFALLGRSPVLGRTFDPGAPDGAVISHAFWQRRFGGDPDVLGRTMALTGAGAAAGIPIVGVMPADFTFPYGSMLASSGFTTKLAVDVWFSMSRERDPRLVDATGAPNRGIHYFAVVARLHDGATVETARTELAGIARQRALDFPDTNAGWGVTVRPLHEQTVGRLRAALLILLGGVGVVLLITCINVANVLLARAAGRGRDLSIRSALGASRGRLIQQMLTESLLLALAGGAAGLGIMYLAIRATLAAAPDNLPRMAEVSTSLPVLAFALVISMVAGLVVGLVPSLSAARSQARDSLRESTRTTASRSRRRIRAGLIVAEVALAMTLAVGGGLLLRSFVRVLNVDPGFNPDNLLTMQIAVPARAAATPASLVGFYDDLESRLRALPGVAGVGGTTRLPLGSTNVTTYLEIEGRPLPRAELPEVDMRRAVYDYFETMQIPVLRGRTFTRDDHPQATRAAVVNDVLAARLFGGEDAVGRRVRFASASTPQPWITIVGVVGSIRHGSLEETPRPELYVTYRQGAPVGPFLVIRTGGDPAQLAGAVRQVMRDLGADPPRDIRTMDTIRSGSVAQRRFMLMLVGTFGVIALGLAALGVFGVVTLIAAERTAEVGIRLALGARPSQVMGMVLRQALQLAVAGIAIGAVASLLLGPVLEAQLFGITAKDPATYALIAVLLLLTAAAGAYVPARRAMSVDPASALRA